MPTINIPGVSIRLAVASAPELTLTPISYDQINVSWDAKATNGLVLERSTNGTSGWVVVGYDGADDTERKLFFHEPSTTYYFRARYYDPTEGYSGYSSVVNASTNSQSGTDYYVATTGSDIAAGTSGAPFATLSKATSVAVAGDRILIKAGTHTDDTISNSFGSNEYIVDSYYASFNIQSSGTEAQPITIKPAAGAEGLVLLDCETTKSGILIDDYDYIHIGGLEIFDMNISGIRNHGHFGNNPLSSGANSTGCVIEDNYVHDLIGPSGFNCSLISPWGSIDWIVRNNKMHDAKWSTGAKMACMQSYGLVNIIVENNLMYNCSMGVMWKDHHVVNATTREKVQESEFRYNLVHTTSERGFWLTNRASNSTEAGNNQVHHNIFYDCTASERSTIGESMAAGYAVSGLMEVYHNIIDNGDAAGWTIECQAGNTQLLGNITTRIGGNSFIAIDYALQLGLDTSDYNIFDTGSAYSLDYYGGGSTTTSTLSTWQGYEAASFVTLLNDYPDVNSVNEVEGNIYTNISTRDYTHKTGGTALNFMADGSHAGAYQTKGEIIGLLPGYTGG